jgi:uncharacterized protein (UPF0212 family)
MSTQTRIPNANPAIVPVEGPAPSAVAKRDPSAEKQRRRLPFLRQGKQDDGASGGTAGDGAQVETGANPYGANNEQLPERMQEALRRLVFQFSTESELSRRQEIRRIKQAHQFWRGLQYLWWDERDQNWHLPFEQKILDNSSIEDLPRYEFVTNIYQAFGLSIISVLSQDVPRVRFFPSSAQAEEDVAAAKAATEVAALVERNNRIGNLIVDEAFHLWTGGKVGAYVRFVVDGQRFGFHPETEIGMREVKIGSDVYVCPECGEEIKADAVGEKVTGDGSQVTGEKQPDSAATPADTGSDISAVKPDACPQCGAMLTEEDFVAAETVTVPAAQTRLRVANGEEVMTIAGGLELKTPPWANDMHEYPYLQWNMEVHQARLRAAYPHAADKIGPPVATSMQEYERLARLAQSQGGPLTEGGDFNINLITFQRTWLRPWAFFALDDKSLRDELLQLFPDGAYVAFAGDAT